MVTRMELWSVQEANGTLSMAGLPASSATVFVGPPLLASGPRSGCALKMSEAFVKRHDRALSSSRLWPRDLNVCCTPPPHLTPGGPEWFRATMLFLILRIFWSSPAAVKMPPPGAWTLVLRTIVRLVNRAGSYE